MAKGLAGHLASKGGDLRGPDTRGIEVMNTQEHGTERNAKIKIPISERFDFKEVSDKLPKVDLPDLKSFFIGMLQMNRRRPQDTDGGLSFKTPDEWQVEPAILQNYQDMWFDRSQHTDASAEHILGVGHRLVDLAIDQARNLDACVAGVPDDMLGAPMYPFRIYDRVTSEESPRQSVICGVCLEKGGTPRVLADWELLKRLNELSSGRLARVGTGDVPIDGQDLVRAISVVEAACREHAAHTDLDFTYQEIELLAVLCPMSRKSARRSADPSGPDDTT